MTNSNYISVNNNQAVSFKEIPVCSYELFMEINLNLLKNNPARHCVAYFGFPVQEKIRLLSCIADDENHLIYILSSESESRSELASLTAENHNFEKFEREIHENFGIGFKGHPWLKPVRYSQDRFDKSKKIENYPFYKVDSEELHEVGVGPIHAGIIEPGHFRFICNGEQIMHLEIQLGYQHRGIEKLFLKISVHTCRVGSVFLCAYNGEYHINGIKLIS